MDFDWEAELQNIIRLERIFSPKRDQGKEARYHPSHPRCQVHRST